MAYQKFWGVQHPQTPSCLWPCMHTLIMDTNAWLSELKPKLSSLYVHYLTYTWVLAFAKVRIVANALLMILLFRPLNAVQALLYCFPHLVLCSRILHSMISDSTTIPLWGKYSMRVGCHSKKKIWSEWITENWELSPVDSTSARIPMHTGYSVEHLTHLVTLASLLLVWVWTRKQFSNWHDLAIWLHTTAQIDFKLQVGTNLTGLYTASRKVSWQTSRDLYSPTTYQWQKHVKYNHHNPWPTAIPNCLTKGQLQTWFPYGCWVG